MRQHDITQMAVAAGSAALASVASAAEKPKVDAAAVDKAFVLPGTPLAVAVTLSEAGRADRSRTLDLIRDRAVAAGIPADALRMTGRAVAGTQLNEGVVKAAWDRSVPWSEWYRKSVIGLSIVVAAVLTIPTPTPGQSFTPVATSL